MDLLSPSMMELTMVSARPNFIKATRFQAVTAARGMHLSFVHSGQQGDEKMSTVFFDQFRTSQNAVQTSKWTCAV